MNQGANISFKNVSKTFTVDGRHFNALEDVSLDIKSNSFTAIVGPSGCGKSTLLNIVARLDSKYQGTVDIGPTDASVAYLFQQPRLLPWLSAKKNITFILTARGVGAEEAESRAVDALRLVGLSDFEAHYPGRLSGGMQQRVALARALVVDPSILLMDEPFSALDELTAHRLRQELLSIYDAVPRTVLFVTHNIAEACALADRVIVMNSGPGRIVAEITIDSPRPRDIDDPELQAHAHKIVSLIGQSKEMK